MLEVEKILKELAKCDPFDPARDRGVFLERMSKLGLTLMGLAVISLVLTLVAYAAWTFHPVEWIRSVGLGFACLTDIAALASLLAEPFAALRLLRGWKGEALKTISHEVANDEAHVRLLKQYPDEKLQYVQHWLGLKIKRIDARIVFFFGGSTAVYLLLAMVYAPVKEMGGIPWLKTVVHFTAPGNYLDTMIFAGIAALFGFALGAIMLKKVQARHTYHAELVELALKQKELEGAKQAKLVVT